MDIADASDKQVEDFTRHAILNRRPDGPPITGECHNCGELIEHPKRWCDKDCFTEYERRGRRLNAKN